MHPTGRPYQTDSGVRFFWLNFWHFLTKTYFRLYTEFPSATFDSLIQLIHSGMTTQQRSDLLSALVSLEGEDTTPTATTANSTVGGHGGVTSGESPDSAVASATDSSNEESGNAAASGESSDQNGGSPTCWTEEAVHLEKEVEVVEDSDSSSRCCCS